MKNIKMNIKKVVINNKVVKLFKKNPKLTWSGTQADLVEIVYFVRLTNKVKNDRGREATMTELTKAFFDLLNAKAPSNPTKIVDNLKKRKKPKEKSLLYRILKYLYHDL
jgi:hypothetical protein